MTTMKRGKYAGATFSATQERARQMARKALRLRVQLSDTLMMSPSGHDRAQWHKRLDWYLDMIERLDNDAVALFPDVDESFVIASMTIGASK